MRNLGLLVAVGLLLTGAAPCESGGGDEASGDDPSQGGGNGPAGVTPGGACTKQPCGEAGSRGEAGASGEAGGAGTAAGGGAGSGASGGKAGSGGEAGSDGEAGSGSEGGSSGGGGGGGVACGSSTCAEGQVCCNPSCGICTEPAGVCTQQACEPPSGGESCDLTCDAGQHCELMQVTCIKAPCPPLPQCVPSPTCAGFAGLACEGEGECVDDPSDDCDPKMGGADCSGYCSCTVGPLIDCAADHSFDPSPTVCACVKLAERIAGEPCGDTTCAAGEVCCNDSCGICTPPDGACIDIFCG